MKTTRVRWKYVEEFVGQLVRFPNQTAAHDLLYESTRYRDNDGNYASLYKKFLFATRIHIGLLERVEQSYRSNLLNYSFGSYNQ